ncbi:hypothetical protein DFJ58DRAFT_451597 [Suillus subalutaceus]|uniref:uncharacterized protein n=1 Tax=Suillus subalutaceus TaxID=48586 RepID=UPI001B85BB0C|nr:uncharacterized protein DFJ58DRAFT_451597 [Suillus subalutaceus]KAG1849458.1 hypothetical protein DFJ58DRAFT_451597 [Suillus subalutaceus]
MHFWSGPLAFQGLDSPHSWLSNEPSVVQFGPVVVEIWRFCVLERLWIRMLILGDLEHVPSRFFGHIASLSGSCHRAIHPLDQTSPWVSTAYPLLIPPPHFCLSHQSSLYRIPIIPILILELFARAIHPFYRVPDPLSCSLAIRVLHRPVNLSPLFTISFISYPFLHQTLSTLDSF